MIGIPMHSGAVVGPVVLMGKSHRFLTAHDAVVKRLLRKALILHHKRRLPRHFQRTNRQRYKHFPRDEDYKRKKFWSGLGQTDLVKSRVSKQLILGTVPQPRVGGMTQPAGGKPRGRGKSITGTLKYRWGFPVTNQIPNAKPDSVTPRKMSMEVETWSNDELLELQYQIAKDYVDEMLAQLSGKGLNRLKLKFAQLAGLAP